MSGFIAHYIPDLPGFGLSVQHGQFWHCATPMVEESQSADLPATHWYPQQGVTNWSAAQERN